MKGKAAFVLCSLLASEFFRRYFKKKDHLWFQGALIIYFLNRESYNISESSLKMLKKRGREEDYVLS